MEKKQINHLENISKNTGVMSMKKENMITDPAGAVINVKRYFKYHLLFIPLSSTTYPILFYLFNMISLALLDLVWSV